MKKSRSKRPPPPAPRAKAPEPAISRPKRWLFRLAAMLLVPLLCLFAVETGLRIAGVGHPMSFFLPLKIDGKSCLVDNDRFGWRFFGPEMARSPFPFVIPKTKPEQTIRVFVFGESAAYGDPQPEFGLPRILTALLEGRYPDKHFEVVNTAMTAINSHVILPIARDCAARNGDFWIVYMGNNEVVGPYGSGTVFGPKAPSLAMVRAGVAFKATRIGQALGGLVRHLQKRAVTESEWGGMTMFVHNHVREDDPRMANVYTNFTRNLDDIIRAGTGSGAKMLVGTMVSNLKDCAPFASDHRPGLTADELSHWDKLYQSGIQALQAGKTSDALDFFQQSLRLDDSFAEANFFTAQCLLALGRAADAAREFGRACDHDTLRFRADSRINEIIRRAGSDSRRKGVGLVDCEGAVAAQSPQGLVGGEFLYEHVHLNFAGNYLVARAFAEQIGRELPGEAKPEWPTLEECAARLAWTDSTQRKGLMDILSRLNDAPFKDQATHAVQYERLRRQIEQLQPATSLDSLRQDEVRVKQVAAAHPDDWVLQENLANLERQTGDTPGAVETLRRVAGLLPQSADAWQTLGLALDSAKRDDEAASAFQKASRLRPESVVATTSLAELYARDSRNEDAVREFNRVLERKPYWGPAHLGLGKVLEALGRTNEAMDQFEAAFKDRVNTPDSYNNLAKFAFNRGWYAAAVTNFTDSLRLYPADPEIHVNLGRTLDKLGARADAKAHFAEAVRLQPRFAEAHFCLGLEFGKDNDSARAAAEFSEAVRLKPELVEAHLNLGIALYNQHLNPEALDQFNEVLRRDANNRLAQKYSQTLRAAPAASAPGSTGQAKN